MSLPETLVLVLYFFVLSILAIYGWHRYFLVYLYMKHRGNTPRALPPPDVLPPVTVQLPIYNEMYVADRLISAVCEMDYPRELLEIQVLDDSTDETRDIAELAVRRHAARGFNIQHLHRTDRTGYKAGALEAGLGKPPDGSSRSSTPTSSPQPTFCTRTLGHFTDDPKVGDGPGPLGAHQRRLLAAHEDPVDPARRALRARARRAEPGRAASSISTARPGSGGGRRSPMRAAGSTTR
jgi:hypothetical protein